MPWTTLTQTESITSRFKLEVLKRIFQNRNFIQKFSSRVYCTFKEPRRKTEHVCTKHRIKKFSLKTPGKILYTSQQLSMPKISSEGASKLKSAGSSRSRHNLVKVHLGLTLMPMFIRDGIPFKTRMDITDSSISFKTECAIK